MTMNTADRLYSFAFRGLLADQALDAAGRPSRAVAYAASVEIANLVALAELDESAVGSAQRMSVVYAAIAAFETSARKLISSVLLEEIGVDWWDTAVSQAIRKRAESRKSEEEKVRWHGARGGALLDYTDLADLGNIVRNNWTHFEAYIPSIDWAASIFAVIERSRNVIMHSGELSNEDIARVGINIRDWTKQVGT